MADLPRVLVVDDSRLVRASLVRSLQGHYEVREEGDGEAAWQTLVLDHSIQAVISDLQMPKLDGYQLLEKVRTSKLRRLQELPFILVSGEETEEERQKAKGMGVSDFISKGSGAAEVLTRLDHLLELTRIRQSLGDGREQMVQDPTSGLFTRKYLEIQTAQAMAQAARRDSEVSVMVLGFDAFPSVCERLGTVGAEQVGTRFAKLLAAKLRREDALGHFAEGQYAIVSPGTSPILCASFANRVREAIEVAHVAAHGQRVILTVSIGVASVPDDAAVSAVALLELAGQRMEEAMAAGGNRIVAGSKGGGARRLGLQHALELLAAERFETVLPHLVHLGQQVLPLIRLMDKEFGLNLPLADIERRLGQRTRAEEKSGPEIVTSVQDQREGNP
ncbi:MAG: response regulator [Dechloromonas sp.]|jgi:diguanylate cyclase (GGDEF)-like protein|nr:response regulator [Dechloromonas sp.]